MLPARRDRTRAEIQSPRLRGGASARERSLRSLGEWQVHSPRRRRILCGTNADRPLREQAAARNRRQDLRAPPRYRIRPLFPSWRPPGRPRAEPASRDRIAADLAEESRNLVRTAVDPIGSP